MHFPLSKCVYIYASNGSLQDVGKVVPSSHMKAFRIFGGNPCKAPEMQSCQLFIRHFDVDKQAGKDDQAQQSGHVNVWRRNEMKRACKERDLRLSPPKDKADASPLKIAE